MASQRDLDRIDQYIAEAEKRIRRQTELVEELSRDHAGTVAEEAQQLLSMMVDGLEELKESRRVILEQLKLPKPP
jgi:archaellum component FlaC